MEPTSEKLSQQICAATIGGGGKVDKYTPEQKKEIAEYIAQLSPLSLKALEIGFLHLGTSFNIYKSIGFLEWKAETVKASAKASDAKRT